MYTYICTYIYIYIHIYTQRIMFGNYEVLHMHAVLYACTRIPELGNAHWHYTHAAP